MVKEEVRCVCTWVSCVREAYDWGVCRRSPQWLHAAGTPPHPFPLHPSLAPWRGVRVPSLVRGHGEGAQPPRAHAWLLHDWSCSTARNSSLPPRPQEAFPLLQPTQRSLLPEIL